MQRALQDRAHPTSRTLARPGRRRTRHQSEADRYQQHGAGRRSHRARRRCQNFSAAAPNRLWVADLTWVATWSQFAYVTFVMDVFSRRIVGWRCSTNLPADLALDAFEGARSHLR